MADEGWCVWIRHCPHPSVPDTACQPRVLTVCRGRCVRRVVVRVVITFWEGEPFASKSPGSRTRPPAVTPYRPYSRCGTNLIECAESARGRRAEWGDVSSSIRYLTVVVDGMWHTRRVCQHANERGSARAHESRLESTRACRVAIASGDTAPAGCGRLWRWGCVNCETNVRIGSDRCVSSTTM